MVFHLAEAFELTQFPHVELSVSGEFSNLLYGGIAIFLEGIFRVREHILQNIAAFHGHCQSRPHVGVCPEFFQIQFRIAASGAHILFRPQIQLCAIRLHLIETLGTTQFTHIELSISGELA